MIDKYFKNIFNFTNYFTIALIVPIGYFAPIGEWLLLSLFAITALLYLLTNKIKPSLNNSYIFLLSIIVIGLSFIWSINQDRTLEVVVSMSGIIAAIYISLNINIIKNMSKLENVIGYPIIITSIFILSDLILETEIRSSLAILVGDKPTSISSNFSRGIIILTMLMPLSVSLYINKNKYLKAFIVFTVITSIIILGPNDSSKVALICALLASLIIYIFGPRAFKYFGIISIIFILFLPIFSSKICPLIGSIEKEIYSEKQKDNLAWQETSIGGSIIHRLLVWEYVGNQIHNKPLLGFGAGTSRLIGQNIILKIPNSNQEIKGGIPLHPHNNFLEIWLELGLLGIIIMSIVWIKIIQYGINIRKESYILGTGVCSSIVTIFIISNLSFGVFQAWWMSSIGLTFLVIFQSTKHKII
jgi:O-antigen ligase